MFAQQSGDAVELDTKYLPIAFDRHVQVFRQLGMLWFKPPIDLEIYNANARQNTS